MFCGFKPVKLRRVSRKTHKCENCGEDVILASFHLVHTLFSSEEILDFKDEWCEAYLDTFSDAIMSLVEEEEEFFLRINEATFPLMSVDGLKLFLMSVIYNGEKEIDFNKREINIRIHIVSK